MSGTAAPARCLLCNAVGRIVPAAFQQLYPQLGTAPVCLDWWECGGCGGWFAYPVPIPSVIDRYWRTVAYNDPRREVDIAQGKEGVQRRILGGLSRWVDTGPLLDFGCNFGQFLLMARDAGWAPSGFEPNVSVAELARAKGFEVRCGWSLQDVGFPTEHFAAITVNDAFCYVWDPVATLCTFHNLLKPDGVLAMRLTNKRFILGLVRAFSKAGPVRNIRISRLLQGQFHSLRPDRLGRIMRGVGFDRIRIQPRAMTTSWSALGWSTRTAYLGADCVYVLSLATINLSPGVLLFARKSPS
jgi:SAM-dependent methyltransferase